MYDVEPQGGLSLDLWAGSRADVICTMLAHVRRFHQDAVRRGQVQSKTSFDDFEVLESLAAMIESACPDPVDVDCDMPETVFYDPLQDELPPIASVPPSCPSTPRASTPRASIPRASTPRAVPTAPPSTPRGPRSTKQGDRPLDLDFLVSANQEDFNQAIVALLLQVPEPCSPITCQTIMNSQPVR